jgi:hypothetical protein
MYYGHYRFNENDIENYGHKGHGVYYCGFLNSMNKLVPLYVGRAVGIGVTVKGRLANHFNDDSWPDVTHFGYIPCTGQEAAALEEQQIKFHQPAYNTIGK